jgi:hypothetical protein
MINNETPQAKAHSQFVRYDFYQFPCLAWTIDNKSSIMYANSMLSSILGISVTALESLSVNDIIVSDEPFADKYSLATVAIKPFGYVAHGAPIKFIGSNSRIIPLILSDLQLVPTQTGVYLFCLAKPVNRLDLSLLSVRRCLGFTSVASGLLESAQQNPRLATVITALIIGFVLNDHQLKAFLELFQLLSE